MPPADVLDDRLFSIIMKFDTSAQDMHKKEPSTSYHRMMRRRRYLLSSSIVILFFTTTNIIVHATTNFCGVDCKFFKCNMMPLVIDCKISHFYINITTLIH